MEEIKGEDATPKESFLMKFRLIREFIGENFLSLECRGKLALPLRIIFKIPSLIKRAQSFRSRKGRRIKDPVVHTAKGNITAQIVHSGNRF